MARCGNAMTGCKPAGGCIMATFPRGEDAIAILVQQMIAGYIAHPELFPHADLDMLTNAQSVYAAAKTKQDNLYAQYLAATREKETALANLSKAARIQLRQSELDTKATPINLEFLGWAKRARASKQPVPGPPRSFKCVRLERGALRLRWRNPSPAEGGPVRSYIVYRRDADQQGTFGKWHTAGISVETTVHLEEQPRGVRLEYYVVAFNNAGESAPSAVLEAILS